MSDLTELLNAAKTVALHDLAGTVLPAIAAAGKALGGNPVAAPSIGIALLQQVESGLVTLSLDEVTEVAAWVQAEADKYGQQVLKKVSGPLAAPAPAAAPAS